MHSRRRPKIKEILRDPKFRLMFMESSAHHAKRNVRLGYADDAGYNARQAAHNGRALLARRELLARVIVATQAREGITTTMDQARAAYDKIQEES